MFSHTLPALKQSDSPYLIHVDGEVMKRCRENGERTQVIRVLQPHAPLPHFTKPLPADVGFLGVWMEGKVVYYCDDIEINGPSWMKTMWDKPLPDRPSAICVVQTKAEVVLTWR